MNLTRLVTTDQYQSFHISLKIYEHVIYARIIGFLDKFNVLYEHQLGFREKYGTNLALTFLIDKIISAHELNKTVLGIFIDLSKIFDTINHDIMLNKLWHYGIRGSAFD